MNIPASLIRAQVFLNMPVTTPGSISADPTGNDALHVSIHRYQLPKLSRMNSRNDLNARRFIELLVFAFFIVSQRVRLQRAVHFIRWRRIPSYMDFRSIDVCGSEQGWGRSWNGAPSSNLRRGNCSIELQLVIRLDLELVSVPKTPYMKTRKVGLEALKAARDRKVAACTTATFVTVVVNCHFNVHLRRQRHWKRIEGVLEVVLDVIRNVNFVPLLGPFLSIGAIPDRKCQPHKQK